MTRAMNGQIMTVDEALALQDRNGEDIKWVKGDDGNYFAEITTKDEKVDKGTDKKPAEFKYFYSLIVRPQVAQVSVQRVRQDRNIPKEIELRSLNIDPADADLYPHIGPIYPEPESKSKSKKGDDVKESHDKQLSAKELKEEQDKKAGKWIDEKEYDKLNKKPKSL